MNSTAVVEETYTGLDDLTSDCLFFVLQEPKDSRVSKQPVLVLVPFPLFRTFVSQSST
jgi:hypothetical protein